jgi:hypothetical protein
MISTWSVLRDPDHKWRRGRLVLGLLIFYLVVNITTALRFAKDPNFIRIGSWIDFLLLIALCICAKYWRTRISSWRRASLVALGFLLHPMLSGLIYLIARPVCIENDLDLDQLSRSASMVAAVIVLLFAMRRCAIFVQAKPRPVPEPDDARTHI